MKTDHKKQIQKECADIFGCSKEELNGKSVRTALLACEGEGAEVYWGCISEDILNSKF